MRYGKRSNGKAHGVINTKPAVAEKMLDLIGYRVDKDLSEVQVLEPSAGTGAFAIPLLHRLWQSAQSFGFDFELACKHIQLCELDKEIAQQLALNIQRLFDTLGTSATLPPIFQTDFLQTALNQKYDVIIGNPPYVRHQQIPDALKKRYQNQFSTFTRGSDLYIAFYERALTLLKKEGRLSFLCANRWLKNQYGRKLRAFVSQFYNVECIIDLENCSVFEEKVLGYPAITHIAHLPPTRSTLYFKLAHLTDFLKFDPQKEAGRFLQLDTSNWFSYAYSGAEYEKNLSSIEQQGYAIGIGVATGRDKIFIRKDFDQRIEKELLLPILTSKDVRGEQIDWQGKKIINPFTSAGQLIELKNYPLAEAYFKSHEEELRSRHVAKKKPTQWFRTIDKIKPELSATPKIILPDISANRFIHVDRGQYYPHHNLYFITGGDYEELCLLASILMSDFIYEQLIDIGNKMSGGYPRWQSQNLRKLQLPQISAIPDELQASLLQAYTLNDLEQINSIITPENIASFEGTEGQLTLFEPLE